jgi:hypothetical protein
MPISVTKYKSKFFIKLQSYTIKQLCQIILVKSAIEVYIIRSKVLNFKNDSRNRFTGGFLPILFYILFPKIGRI